MTNKKDEQNYSRALLKRIEAEVLLDMVCQTTEIPEKFPGVPAGSRAIQLWDSGVSHYFLKLFGRPVRASACECERVSEPGVAQVLHLLNSPEIHAKLAHDGWFSCHSCHTDGHTNSRLNDSLGDGSFGAPKRVLSLLGVNDTAPWAWNGGIQQPGSDRFSIPCTS